MTSTLYVNLLNHMREKTKKKKKKEKAKMAPYVMTDEVHIEEVPRKRKKKRKEEELAARDEETQSEELSQYIRSNKESEERSPTDEVEILSKKEKKKKKIKRIEEEKIEREEPKDTLNLEENIRYRKEPEDLSQTDEIEEVPRKRKKKRKEEELAARDEETQSEELSQYIRSNKESEDRNPTDEVERQSKKKKKKIKVIEEEEIEKEEREETKDSGLETLSLEVEEQKKKKKKKIKEIEKEKVVRRKESKKAPETVENQVEPEEFTVRRKASLHGCNICDKLFTRKDAVKRHIREVHNLETTRKQIKDIQCPHCSKMYLYQGRLRIHLRTHTGEYPFVCSVCDKSFLKKYYLQRHLLNIHDIAVNVSELSENMVQTVVSDAKRKRQKRKIRSTEQQLFPCPFCNKHLKTEDQLNDHTLTHESGFICEVCFRSFSTNAFLIKHTRSEHQKSSSKKGEDDEKMVCLHCQKEYIGKKKLERHIKALHVEKPYVCVECSKCFATERGLKIHQHVHSKDKPKSHTCSECPCSFARLVDLRKHQRVHSKARNSNSKDSPSQCEDIDKSINQFVGGGNNRESTRDCTHYEDFAVSCVMCLNEEKKCQEHEEMDYYEEYACGMCTESVLSRKELKVHLHEHGAFVCEECRMAFSNVSQLAMHLQCHLSSEY